MNTPFDYIPDAECDAAFRRLLSWLESLKNSGNKAELNFCRELETGKMLGVLIAVDSKGVRHALYAFSGQVGEGGFHHSGFVGPVFDYPNPDGYFKKKEAEISALNLEILLFERNRLAPLENDYESEKRRHEAVISEYKEKYRLSKQERDARRKSGEINEAERDAMIRQSQFEKAELQRLKKRMASRLQPLSESLKEANIYIEGLKNKRRSDSERLQKWLFDNFRLLNARGDSRSLSEIFADTSLRVPPSGAGECCAPKLLQAAYIRGLHPVAIAEYWYGNPKGGEVRRHGDFYPACRGKCLPVLSWMLQGLDIEPPLSHESGYIDIPEPEIIFENEWFCIVDKPSGMLSVPGKGSAISLQQWLEKRYGVGRQVKMAHRLDQDTSGLIVATFGNASFKVMQSLFATRKVNKTYVADLDGSYTLKDIPRKGRINLPLSPDWLDRPRQRVDFEGGKEGITDYEFLEVSAGRSRIMFHPLTGRTHQLRVHSASEQGLGMPIAGDRLYGRNRSDRAERLHLHSYRFEFTFPTDGRHYCFESPVPF